MARETTTRAARRDLVVRARRVGAGASVDVRVHAVRVDDASTPRCVVLDAASTRRRARDADEATEATRAVRTRDAAMQRVMCVAASHGVGCEEIVRTNAVAKKKTTTCAPVVATRRVTIGKRKNAREAVKGAHADFIREFREVCGGGLKESGETTTKASEVVSSRRSESTSTVIFDSSDEREESSSDARLGIAVTTRHAVRTVQSYRPRWRRWLPERAAARWPTNPNRQSTAREKTVSLDVVTVAEPMSLDADDVEERASDANATPIDWSWPFLHTGTVADGLIRAACVRNDGRERTLAAAVEIADDRALAEPKVFTYEDLFARATKVASFMREALNVKPGDVVGVLSANSHEVYVLHYACAMTRCVLLNLNTHLVGRELAYITRDSACKAIFARGSHGDVLREVLDAQKSSALDSIVWIDDDDSTSTYPRGVRNYDWNLDVVAYEERSRALVMQDETLSREKNAQLYYTSGTTGNPKGVCLTHDIVRLHASATSEEMNLHESDVWLHAAPMFHLVDAFAIYSITDVAGRHVFLQSFEASRLLRVIALERVTVSNLASTMVTILSHNPYADVCDLSSVRLLSCGGSPLPPTVVKRAIALFGCEFFVSYGMTECCGKISMSILSEEFRRRSTPEEQLDAICTSGRPFKMISVKVTRSGNPREEVPRDGETVGDIRVKGPTVFLGYLNNPDATSRAFDDDGWFTTGDLGVVRPDGYIVVVDRKKDMILSGGENVYCVEVERVLHAHESVKHASVFGIPHAIMGETVHAAMTLRCEREDVDDDALKRDLAKHCADRLSQFKCPVEFHFVEQLPMNANGKVLKRSLRELITDSAHHRLESRSTPLQRQFSRAVITPDPKTSARTKVSLDAQPNVEIEGAEIYTSSLTPLPACERVDVDAFRSGRWWMLGTHVRLSESLRALGARTCVASNVFDARASWLDHASRYFRALEKIEDGDAVVLTECLYAFEIAHSGADANADASTSIASATFMISGLVIALLQAVHALGRKNVRVVVVTSNAFVASDESELDGIRDGHVSHAPVMAMLRVLRREHPNIDFATLDMPRDHECVSTEGLECALRRIVDVEGAFAEREIAVNDSCASVPRLRRALPPRVDATVSMSFGHGACVIVGGLGALGLMHLSFFVETFDIRRFVLVGRSVRDVDAVKRAVARARGLEVYVVAADCCDKDQCRAVFALAEPVSVTLHLAGVLHEAAAVDVTRASFVDAVEAKIIGSLNVFDQLSRTPSDVALASTSIFGSIGQTQLTCYAAANAFQDALCAVYDRSTSFGPRRVVAVQWGTWDEDGMAARAGDAFRSYWRSVGMGFLSPGVALEFARRVIAADGDSRPTMACFPPTNWLTFANATRARGAPTAFIEECLPPLEDSSSSSSVSSDARASPARAEIAKIARDVVLDVLDARDVGDDDPLMSVGLTSTRAIQLTDKLSRAIGRDVPSTLAFDYPTLRAVVDFLAPSERVGARVRDGVDDGENDGRRRVDVFVGASSTVAPTRAGDGTAAASGVDVVGVVPATRWDANARLAGAGDALCPFGAFIDDVAAFDFELFGVSRAEARVVDPQQRLVLRAVRALPPPSPDASVHVGISQIEHPRACVDVRRDVVSPHYATSAHLSVAAGRVSYVFDLRGCAESVDTACSSSLVAVHRAFVSRETDAVAGGVNLVIDVTWSLACRAAGMLAADGRCKTLDASADGYVRAERCAFALLGPTRDEANLRLAGAAVNQDGRSSSLTAPNGPSQTRVIRAAYEDGRAPERVSLHGTGTPLGDPIEVGALKSCANADDGDARVVWLAATKSSVGHAEPASGIVALLLSATTIRDAVAVPVAHLRGLNHHVVGASTDASSARCVARRERGAATHDASSSSASAFAFQGTNAHALARASSASRASTTFTETRALDANAHCWFDRVPHACVVSVDVAYGRLVYASIVVGARPCAALFDHVVRGEPIAPATAMLELFAETVVADAGADDDDTARRAHARDVVIPQPMRLTPVSLVARVVARRRDGRVSVVTGPLCRPRTHLYGRVAAALAVTGSRERFRRASFAPRSTRRRRHMRAVIGRRGHARANQPRAWHADVVVVDACVHSAESVVQFDGACAARVPAALDSMAFERRRRDESSSASSMTVTGETSMDARANRRSRASRDHRVDGARLRGLDVRPPLRRAMITSNVSKKNDRASSSTYATARETRPPNASEKRSKSAEKRRRAARSDVRLRARRDVASFVQTHHRAFAPACAMRTKGRDAFDTPAALAGAARSALHELAPSREISYVATHVSSTRDADVDALEDDPWCAPCAAHGTVSSARLVPVRLAAGRRRRTRRDRASFGSPVRRRAAAVVYGGLGALGFAVARASRDAGEDDDDLVLVGRRGKTARDVSSSSTRVLRVLRVDAALAEDSSDVPRLERARVIYASGVLADASLSRISAARVFVTFAPKTEACRDAWLDSSNGFGCRAYFSSATACVGNAGQCAYGAANATLDRRNARAADAGVECASMQWGAFSGGGMASRVEGRMVELGVGLVSPESGAAFAHACLASRTAWRRNEVCASAFDWSRYVARHARATTTAFFRDVVGGGAAQSPAARSTPPRDAVAETRARGSVDAKRIVTDAMKTTLGVDVGVVNDAPLFELGLDSLSSVEFTAALDAALGRPLPATLVFDYPSASALVRFIETLDDSSDTSASSSARPLAPTARDDVVAERRLARRALGFAFADVPGRFADADGVSPIDRGRWDADAFADIPRFSGLCADATWRDFDGDAFGARSNEVVVTDPQQRATLRHAARCFARQPPPPNETTTAVYIGAATCDYKSVCVDAGASSNPFFSAGCAFVSVIAGRVSFVFNLSGASLAIDTACSSALCAAHCARIDVDADRWCVGGVNALFDARTSAMFARAGMLTPDGRCKTLDAAADGYARAEACVVLLATRVDDDSGSRSNDTSSSSSTVCMAGTAVNQDGRSSSLVAPNGPSQTRAIRDATATANVDDLDAWRVMSLHGTGTALGDPIEIGALRAFARSRGTNRSSSSTSLLATKSARAHSESPSGLIGLTAACDALTRKLVGQIVHLRSMNAHCARDAVDARVVAPRTRAARFGGGFAGTSAFAFQGTNAHCVAVVSTTTISMMTRRGDILWNTSRHWPLVDAVACARRPTYVAASREYKVRVSPDPSAFDHVVHDRPVLPGAAFLVIARASAAQLSGTRCVAARSMCFVSPCVLVRDSSSTISMTISAATTTFRDATSRRAFATGRSAVTIDAPVMVKTRCASLARVSLSRAVVVAGIIRRSGESELDVAVVDASFQFLAATWTTADATLKIPTSVDAFLVDDRARARVDAADASSTESSTHSAGEARAIRLRVRAISGPSSSGGAVSTAAASVEAYAMTTHRKLCPHARAETRRVVDSRPRPLLGALAFPTFYESLRLTESCSSHGVVAALRSVALERRRSDRVRVASACARTLERRRVPRVERGFRRRAARLAFLAGTAPGRDEMIVVGGTGAVGGHVTRYLAPHAFSHVRWASTSGRGRRLDATTRLLRNGALTVAARDGVFSLAPVAPVVVVHAAGALADASFRNISAHATRVVVASKRASTDARATTIFCTSVAGALGSIGQASYAGANEMLDARASASTTRGLRARAFQFGPWSGGGMGDDDEVRARLRAMGVAYASPEETMAVVRRLAKDARAPSVTCVCRVDWRAYAEATGRCEDELLERVVGGGVAKPTTATTGTTTTKTRGRDDALETVLACVERVVGTKIDVSAPFMDSGVDSIASTELADELSRAFSMKLSSTFLFDYPTPAAAARFVAGDRAIAKEAPPRHGGDGDGAISSARDRVIIVGARVECDVSPRDVDESQTIPHEKWSVDALRRRDATATAALPTTFVNAMSHVSHFDTDVFGVNHEESRRCDCQQRLALRAASVGLDDVGTRVGVHLGVASREYGDAVAAIDPSSSTSTSSYDAVGSFVSVVSGRVSYVFDFTGPSCSVDTACSSSLVAAHHARAELTASTTVVVVASLVGGVNVILHPRVTEQFNRAGMLSPSGRCHALDALADGYARAESCRMFRFSVKDDENGNRNDDDVVVLIARASAVNQDGRSSALTAPNGNAQRAALAACERADADGVVAHLHGTGTPLGDPIEVIAVAATMKNARLEASKSWFGHAEPASGVVSLSFLAAHLSAETSFGARQLAVVNPHLVEGLASTSIADVNRERTSCARVDGGASAFAFQGTNARVALWKFRRGGGAAAFALERRLRHVEHARRFWFAMEMRPVLTRASVVESVSPRESTVVRFHGDCDGVVDVKDHRVDGRPVFPGAGMMHLMSCAGECLYVERAVASTDLVVASVMRLSERETTTTYVVVARVVAGACSVSSDGGERCASRYLDAVPRWRCDDTSDTTHDDDSFARTSTADRLRATHDVPIDARAFYDSLLRRGLEYGRRFRALRDIRGDGARSRIAVARDTRTDAAFIAALDGAFHLGAPLDSDAPLAIPVGADASRLGPSTTRFDEARARAVLETKDDASSRSSFSSHALVPNGAREDARVVRLGVKSVARRRVDATSRETRADTYACARRSTCRHAPVVCRGAAVDDFARHAATCLGVVASRRDASWRVVGVDAEHTGGLFKTAASESYDIDATWSRGYESCACVDVLTRARCLNASRRRPGTATFFARPPSSDDVRVFGGFGALGGVTASSALRARAPEVVLTGRTGRGRAVDAFFAPSTRFRCSVVRGVASDVAARCDVDASPSAQTTRDVFASGTLVDGALSNHTARGLFVVCAPKPRTVERRRRRVASPSSARFMSSVASLLGSSGQANYAAANGALDFIARARRRAGSDDVAVQFGPWLDVGMATRREATMRRLSSVGVRGLSAERGARVLETTCRFASATTCVAAFDLRALAASATHLDRAFFGELGVVAGTKKTTMRDRATTPTPTPSSPSSSLRFADVQTSVSAVVARVLGATVDADTPLMQHGLDSLSAVDLAAAVGTRFAVDAPSTLFFDHPTVAAAAREIVRRLGGDATKTRPVASLADAAPRGRRETPRVVVFAGATPLADADAAPRDAVIPTPVSRERDAYEGATNAFGGFVIPTVARLAVFDPLVFGPASAGELATLDPRQRLTLDATAACTRALDDARSDCGVYVGCAGKDYAHLLRSHGVRHDAFKGTGNESSVVAGRVSFVFAFRGPSVSVDTACSSSLCAAVVALDGLAAAALSRAFVVGASLILTDDMHRVLGGAGMLSPSGRCKTFDADADGYGRGEGVETLVASTVASDGGGTGTRLASGRVNQDGRSSALTAPNGTAQEEAMHFASRDASLIDDAADDDDHHEYVDATLFAHGTGTALGDPIEANASSRALCRPTRRVTFQALKSWIGHAEPASGALALAVGHEVACRARRAFGACHLRRLSPYVRVDRGAYVPRANASLGSLARVNVHTSAFAFQGTNAHVVMASSSEGVGRARAPRVDATFSRERRFWPTRAPTIRAVETTTTSCACTFTVRWESSRDAIALCVRAAVERALDDDSFTLARFVVRRRGAKDVVVVRVRAANDGVTSSASVARVRRGLSGHSRRGVTTTRAFVLARRRATPRRLARARGFGVFDADVDACEAMVARHVDASASVTFAETTNGGASCASLDDGASLVVAVGVRRRHRSRGRVETRVAYEVVDRDRETRTVVTAPTTARMASTTVALTHAAFAVPSRSDAFVAVRCGEGVETVLRSARRELDVGGGRSTGRVFEETRPVRALDESSSLSPPLSAAARRDVLVVGGTGALGRVVVNAAARSSVAASRRGRASADVSAPHERVVVRADSSLRSETRDVFARCAYETVVHAAGLLADGTLLRQTHAASRDVFAPKLVATTHARQTTTASPRFHVYFSSIAALVSPAGQANYASANAALDELAVESRERGFRATSVRWGAFEGAGMASTPTARATAARLGLGMLPVAVGARVLAEVLAGAATPAVFVVSPLASPPFASSAKTTQTKSNSKSRHSVGADDVVRASTVERAIETVVADLVGVAVPRDAPMMRAGLDSVSSVELRDIVCRRFDVRLPATAAFDHPTIRDLAARVVDELSRERRSANGIAAATEPALDASSPRGECRECVAFARSGRFPVGALGDDDDALLRARSDAAVAVPVDRWRVRTTHDDARFGAFLSHIDAFDRAYFATGPAEAAAVDPQHRGALERVAACRLDVDDDARDVCVFAGIQHVEYGSLCELERDASLGPFAATGRALSACAGRVSFVFGFRGAAVAVDTACSASLVTMHLAFGDRSSATAHACVGVNYTLARETFDAARVAGMLARDGRCKTFDASADGYGRAEAVACLFMRAASSRCRETASASSAFVVRSTACGQDGRSSSLTAPNGPAQTRVVVEARRALGPDADEFATDVSTHGTGTPLGDPIECESLRNAFEGTRDGAQLPPLALSASKSRAGHAEAAAGSTATFQLAARLVADEAPFVVGLRVVNPYVRAPTARCRIPRARSSATRRARVAGCSAFAFVGTNAHVVVGTTSDDATTAARRRVAFDREACWSTVTPPNALKRATRAVSGGSIAFVARTFSAASGLAMARIMVACASACVDSYRTRRRIVGVDVVVAPTNERTAASFRVRCARGEATNDASGASCRFASARERRVRSTTRAPSAFATSETTVRLCAYAVGGHDGDGLDELVVVARRARVRCVDAYAPTDDASTSSEGAATFSVVTTDDATRVCPTRRARETARGVAFDARPTRGVAFDARPTRGVASVPTRATEREKRPTEEIPRRSRRAPPEDVAAVVDDVLLHIFGERVDPSDDLASRGLDSIGAVELATTLARRLELEGEIDTPTLATLPTPRAVTAFVMRAVGSRGTETESETTPLSRVVADADADSTRPATRRDAAVKCLKPSASAPSLFLGAPAFGDGQLAYMKLVRALELGAHPAHTLERDVTEEPWPRASIEHAREIERRQREGPIVVGGHSLGGVLAVETALALERAGRDVSTILLFDAPHPVQFKSEWNDVPEPTDDADDDEGGAESTGLTYMEVALTSFHFDTVAAGWSTMTREEKYAVFEDVAFQALGREFDARRLDREISGGPYAAQWNSGMRRMDDGSIDTGSWWMLRGAEAAGDAAPAPAKKKFSRLRGKVVHYKAGIENSALFETTLRFDGGRETLESVGGYVWALSCDHVEIVRCRGTHMNLMTMESDGGDLGDTVVPHARRELADAWEDAMPTTRVEKTNAADEDSWTSRAWHRPLGLWMRVSPNLADVVVDVSMNDDDDDDDDDDEERFPSVVDDPDRFDEIAFGLNRLAWHAPATSTPHVWLLADLLRDVSSWSHACFASAAPCRAVHLPDAALRALLDDDDAQAIAARCVRAIRRAAGLRDPSSRFDIPVVVAVLGFDAARESIACETARQLIRRGERAIAVIVPRPDASLPRDDDPCRASRPALQALRAVLDDARPAADDDFAFLLARFRRIIADADLGASRRRVVDAAKRFVLHHRPPTTTTRAWRAAVDDAVALAERVVDAARDAFHPDLVGARP